MDGRRRVSASGRMIFKSALLLTAVAFCFRTCALSPGPDRGVHYHPDMAKQVRAVQQFLNGDYLVISHQRNYDGYPLFNSHLVEFLVRAADPPVRTVLRHLGVAGPESPPGAPDPTVLFWVTLLWNCLLSAAAVGIAVLLGRRFGSLAGVLAGALAAVSPLDIAAAHYAVNDTAAAFFALVTIYLSVRVLETGRVRYYALGALATAAAFSCKYNGAEAGVALAAAHLLRHPGRQALLSAAAWRRIGAAACAGALGVVLTTPSLLVNPAWTIASIRQFIGFAANFGLSEAQVAMPLGERLLLGLRANGQLLARVTGLFALAGAATALLKSRPRGVVWAIASLPLAHLLIAFGAKPSTHPVHHLPVVVPLLVLAGAGMAALLERGRPLPARAAGVLLAAGGIIWLAAATRDELFFFSRSDTRRIAETWAQDSLPSTVAVDVGHTFPSFPPPGPAPQGRVAFISRGPRPSSPPWEFRLARFFLEESSLPVFRNPPVDVVVGAPALLSPEFSLPLWQPIPAGRADNLVFVEAPAFYRSPLVRDVAEGAPLTVTAVSRRRLQRAWLVLRGGDSPCSLTLGFGGRTSRRLLGAGEFAVVPAEDPEPVRRAYQGNSFYAWSARARFGRARVALVTDAATLGRYLFNAGFFKEAESAFATAGTDQGGAGRRLEAVIVGLASGSLTGMTAETLAGDVLAVPVWDRDEVRRRFGIHPDWLDGLPYLTLTQADLAPAGSGPRRLILEPGHYRGAVSCPRWNGPLHLAMRDGCGRVIRGLDLAPPAAGPSRGPGDDAVEFSLVIERGLTAVSIEASAEGGAKPPEGLTVSLRPDVLATVQGRLDLLRRLLGRTVAGDPGPLEYEALLSSGDQAQNREQGAVARELYRLAAAAAPSRRGARERQAGVSAIPPRRAVGARFQGGIELVSSRIAPPALTPGGSAGLELQWRLPDDLERPDRISVWVHAVDSGGRIVFQGDHPLLDDMRLPPGDDREDACLFRFPVPREIAPGSYELRVGLWLPSRETNVRLLDAPVPHGSGGLSLGTVGVAPRPGDR